MGFLALAIPRLQGVRWTGYSAPIALLDNLEQIEEMQTFERMPRQAALEKAIRRKE